MIIRILLAIILFFIVIWIMGSLFLTLIRGNKESGNAVFIGFFIYFSFFQILALPMIITFRPLSWLSVAWGIVVIGCCICMIILCRNHKIGITRRNKKDVSIEGSIMLLLVALQTYLICVKVFHGWDTAYYIANVNTSINTNTMYLFEGTLGRPEVKLNLRYALSSFYMHDAVVGQIFGLPGALVCRYFNGMVCSVFSVFIMYKIGVLIFCKRRWAELTVIFGVFANLEIGTTFFASSFLMERSYEAKAYCCNIVIPALIYVILKIYKEPNRKENWIWLFIVNFSSVAISESSMLLVPVLNGCLLMGHCVVDRRIRDLGKMMICLIPNICYLLIYLLYSLGVFTIKISV